MQRHGDARGFLGCPLHLVRRSIRAQPEDKLGFHRRKPAFEYRKFHQLLRRREADAAPEDRPHEAILAEALQPWLAYASNFPARNEVRPERDRPVLVRVRGIEGRRNASRKVRKRRCVQTRTDKLFCDGIVHVSHFLIAACIGETGVIYNPPATQAARSESLEDH